MARFPMTPDAAVQNVDHVRQIVAKYFENEVELEVENDGITAEQLQEALADLPKSAVDYARIESMVAERVDAMVATRAPRTLRVESGNGKKKVTVDLGAVHKEFETLLHLVQAGEHVYLYGRPGGGKSHGAHLVATALSRKYGYISLNPQTPDSRLLGYLDANGKYHSTVLYDLYKNGGVFCIDEMDNASASLLTTLNALLENGLGAFPCGMVQKHPDFIVVATGNTTGRGGNRQFPERRPFDAAFAERFVFLEWDYDETLERTVALNLNPNAGPWVAWVQRVRAFAVDADPTMVVSPRATFKIAKLLSLGKLRPDVIAEVTVFKGIGSDRTRRILNSCPMPLDA